MGKFKDIDIERQDAENNGSQEETELFSRYDPAENETKSKKKPLKLYIKGHCVMLYPI